MAKVHDAAGDIKKERNEVGVVDSESLVREGPMAETAPNSSNG
jgi:hypothetical protein